MNRWISVDNELEEKEEDILVKNLQTGEEYEAHYAYGGGEDQPRFGPAWFYNNGCMYVEVDWKFHKWRPLSKGAINGRSKQTRNIRTKKRKVNREKEKERRLM